MVMRRATSWIGLGALSVMLPLLAPAQDNPSGKSTAAQPEARPAWPPASAKPSPTKQGSGSSKADPRSRQGPVLLDLTRVSTEDAARRAAASLAKGAHQQGPAGKAALPTPAGPEAGDSAVREFHPADAAQTGPAAIPVSSKSSRKSALKNVHGAVYGSADPKGGGDHATGGSAGTSSKSGRTSVYIETDQSRASSPH